MDALGLLLSSPALQFLSVSIREQLEQWFGSSNELSICISGRTGGGKSTLVNALLGEEVAEEGAEPDPTTTEVTCYERLVSGVRVKVWDSPGLQDGTRNEEQYLADIAAKCGHVDLLLFCINVGDAIRFNADSPEVKAMAKLTEKLSTSIWDHAIIALTFANRLGQTSDQVRRAKRKNDTAKLRELFCEKVREWQEFLRHILLQIGLSPSQLSRLKIVPTGHRSNPVLPDRPHWLSTFWFEALRSTDPRAQPALLRMNETRIVENPDTVNKDTRRKHSEDQTFIYSEFAGDVGRMIYGSENIGCIAGQAMAQIKELELKERIVLEQFFIMKTIQQQDSSHPDGSVCIDQELSEPPLDATLEQLELEPPPEGASTSAPVSVPSSLPSGLTSGTPQNSQRAEEENLSPKPQCGGPLY